MRYNKKLKILVLNPPVKNTKNIIRDVGYGCWCSGKRIAGATVPPFSLLLAATILNKKYDVVFLDAHGERMSSREVAVMANEFDITIICTSTLTFNNDADVLKEIKNANPHIKTVIYGSHPTFMPEQSLQKDEVDIIIRREPEYILCDLIEKINSDEVSWKKIKGIGYKENNGKYVINDYYPFITDLDDLPFPNTDLLAKKLFYFNPLIKRIPYITTATSRGCPGKCTFCTAPLYSGSTLRFNSAEYVLDEIEYFSKKGYKEVYFRDETFFINKKRDIQICEGIIEKKIDVTWICNARVDMVDKETLLLAKRSGCHFVKFGVESGVQRILNNVKKGINIEDTIRVFELTRKIGIDTHAHVMLGMPGEDAKTIRVTIDFVKRLQPTTVTFGICTPYPGTPLFNEVYTNLSKGYLEKELRDAYRNFYLRPSYLFFWLRKINNFQNIKKVAIAGFNLFDFILSGNN